MDVKFCRVACMWWMIHTLFIPMKKTLLVLLTLCSLLIGTNAIGEEPKPVTPEPQSPAPAEKAYWLTIKSSIRHNSKCKYYHHSKGRPCDKDEGRPCKICGGWAYVSIYKIYQLCNKWALGLMYPGCCWVLLLIPEVFMLWTRFTQTTLRWKRATAMISHRRAR